VHRQVAAHAEVKVMNTQSNAGAETRDASGEELLRSVISLSRNLAASAEELLRECAIVADDPGRAGQLGAVANVARFAPRMLETTTEQIRLMTEMLRRPRG
jgi:hypothetical protein